MMHQETSGYLTGKLLIATHSVCDGCFDKTVIYLCAHDDEGALGVVINMPLTGTTIKTLMQELKIKPIVHLPDSPVHFGGPVDTNQGFVLHSNDQKYKGTREDASGICFSSGISLLEDIAAGTGPDKRIVALGCAGWSAGQLEEELEAGSWIIAPATTALMFETDAQDKWEKAAGSLGVDLNRLSSEVGHA